MPATLSTTEAARTLGVAPRTVRRYATAGKLPAERGANGEFLFNPDDVLAAHQSGLCRTSGEEQAAPGPVAAAATPEWLLVHEAAALLRMSERVVREQAALGVIPGRRYGGHWRIHRSAVEAPPAR
ncbi:helix-turn-helix domain-containing protein [Streptomyces sp. NPDC059979]|uniref:helix-turn-helix domain-containing protein n=1 Tax=Streptomyces sp. NPDC059979 TaxID=3347021 RepID=UPI0036A32F48